jgi:NAD(P)H-flavin reductase/hemoglobin-like flavoprotein
MTISGTPPVQAPSSEIRDASVDAAGLKRSWELVNQYGDQVPLFFYSTLFLSHPYTRAMFPVSMAAQRDRLVSALGRIVSRVDDLDEILPMLRQLGRDHRKFAVVRDHYPAVGDALLATLEHFCGAQWSDELAHDWRVAYAVVSRVMIEAADSDADSPAWWEATVVSHERRTADVAVLTVRPEGKLSYLPGQSIPLESPQRPRVWRYYSPAGLPDDNGCFDLHVKLVDGGAVSTALVQSTQAGDALRLGPPVGQRLTIEGHTHDMVLIAGGTGLAPLKALLHQVATEGGERRVTLFWGARYHRELYDLPGLHKLTHGNDRLRVVPCVSDDVAMGGGVETGSVVDVALRHGPWPDHEIYVCGSPAMVDGSLTTLENAGTSLSRVHTDELGHEETLP